LVRVHKRDRDEGGQTLIFFVLAMPLFLAIIALVVDGSMVLVKKRALQNAADAAALAAAQDWPLGGPCVGACLATLQTSANNYSDKNGGPSLHPCNDPDPTHPTDTNCFAAPYVDKSGTAHDGQVEVRLTVSTPTLFTKAIGLKSLFDVSARSVAGSNPILGSTTLPGTTVQGTTILQTTPGGTHTTTDPSTDIGNGGIAFTLSRRCDAIDYEGAGSGTAVLGAFATNGGLKILGNAPKKVTTLYYNKPGCPNNPPVPPSGTNQCTAVAWGDASDSNNLCVKTLVDLNASATLPINWPLAPPPAPTPLPAGVKFDPTTDYPSKCADPGTTSIDAKWSNNRTNGSLDHPPGIYCVTGAGTTLTIGGGPPSNRTDLTTGDATGDGYTFFALNGAKITIAGNTTKMSFYWPSACGPRPTTRPPSFTCFTPSRTISGYDPQTLLYASNQTYDPNACSNNAICLNGQNDQMTGDIFAPKPDVFPPGPTDTGGTAYIAGGALAAGSGFFESWMLFIQGNTGNYSGTGVPIAIIPGQTHTTTDPSTTQTIIQTGTTNPGTVVGTTIGTDIGLGE
jgi:Putative Flp pilus-assembly TadE/G-like